MFGDAGNVFCRAALRLWRMGIEGCHTRGSRQIVVVIPLFRSGSPLAVTDVTRTCEERYSVLKVS